MNPDRVKGKVPDFRLVGHVLRSFGCLVTPFNQDIDKIDGYLSRLHPRNSSNDSLTSSVSFPS